MRGLGVTWIVGGLLVLSGAALGQLLPDPGGPGSSGEAERGVLPGSRLTSPFIEASGLRDGDTGLVRIRDELRDRLTELRRSDPTLAVSIYLRDLDDGPWIGIDETVPYMPASLMKVAVLFHALERMGHDPELASRMMVYPGPEAMPSPDNLVTSPDSVRMVPGRAYRFDELLERMIVHSDNHAKDLVLQGVEPGAVEIMMNALGIPPRVEDGVAVMDARRYAAFFRILYHSAVFSREHSELALDLLARSSYRGGMRASLPTGIPVASKFGFGGGPFDPEVGTQVHECGIVYAPGDPYVLCVMTRSLFRSIPELAAIVADVSARVFRGHAS